MKLPSLKVSLPLIFLCWCLVGVQVHGTVLLAYPAMWAAVGLFFFGLHVLIKAPANSSVESAAKNSATAPSTDPVGVADESATDHQISAPV